MTTRDTELKAADDWMRAGFGDVTQEVAWSRLPLSFRYSGAPMSDPGTDWQADWLVSEETPEKRRRRLTLSETAAGMICRCEVTQFLDFPAVEWAAQFENTGAVETEVLSDLLPLEAAFAAGSPCRVHFARGSECRRDDFAPQIAPLGPTLEEPQAPYIGSGNPVCLQSLGGRSSCGMLPFFNVDLGTNKGILVAVGWTGDWAARIWREENGAVRIQAGMKQTHLRLQPGESVRTPRILLLFWEGNRTRGQNLLRQFILKHHTPRRNGQPLQAPVSMAVWGENRTERQIGKLRWLVENKIPVDNFWIDAGWHGDGAYKDDSTVFNSEWGKHVGNWWPNPVTYPHGLRPIGDAVDEAGLDFTLWFEPERVFKGTELTREHPEWLLGPIGENYLLNLGIPEARHYLTEMISALITEGHITCYRQDFNTDPAPFWQSNDDADSVGMTEIQYITGLYAFWDELLARHPSLFIDNCSSGGRRIDLESISRSIPLWRSDYQCFPGFDPAGMQGQTHGLSLWLPLSTGACDRQDTYAFRSALGPGMVLCTPPNPAGVPEGFMTPWDTFAVDWLHERLNEQKRAAPFFYGDFYPLLTYNLADDQWAAWQFDRPDLGKGIVQAFRRPESPFDHMDARLQGLDPAAFYEVEDEDSGWGSIISGEDLMAAGFTITIDERPGSSLVFYRRFRDQKEPKSTPEIHHQ